MATLKYLTAGEAKIARKLVREILAYGLAVSVYDGEETTLKRSRNGRAILAALGTTGGDTLSLWWADGSKAGWFSLVYGNDPDGSEVICDYSDNETANQIWESLNIE